jgi:hypothetical protein
MAERTTRERLEELLVVLAEAQELACSAVASDDWKMTCVRLGIDHTMEPHRAIEEWYARLTDADVVVPYGYRRQAIAWQIVKCHCDVGWTHDENWSPDDLRTWRGERTPGNGLIPCGACNLGGWDAPWPGEAA